MDTLTLNGEVYVLKKKQRSGIKIYRGDASYVRIGDPRVIDRYLAVHRRMIDIGYPIAPLLDKGTIDAQKYYIEKSLGDKRFLEIFVRDIRAKGTITPENFDRMLTLVERCLRAQIASPAIEPDAEIFARAIRLDMLSDELPRYREKIRDRFTVCMDAVKKYPFRFLHGDFNPANMFPNGIIDFEDTSCGPFGYDAVSAIMANEWFPRRGNFEFKGHYYFTKTQLEAYRALCDRLCVEYKLPLLSAHWEHFEFFRAIWLTTGMSAWPVLQKHRMNVFIDR